MSTNKSSSHAFTLPALVAVLWFMLSSHAVAVDPLPPELENAPLKAQAAWRQKTGRESQEERTQVAQKRFEQRMAHKQTLMAQVHREAAERRDAVLTPVPAPLPVVESEIVSPKERNALIAFLLFVAFGFLIRRHFQLARHAGA